MDLERILNKMVNGVGTNLARILSGSSTDLEADPLVHSTQSLRPHRARPFLPISLFLLSRLLSIPPLSFSFFSLPIHFHFSLLLRIRIARTCSNLAGSEGGGICSKPLLE